MSFEDQNDSMRSAVFMRVVIGLTAAWMVLLAVIVVRVV